MINELGTCSYCISVLKTVGFFIFQAKTMWSILLQLVFFSVGLNFILAKTDGLNSRCLYDGVRTACGSSTITEQECAKKDCCWEPVLHKPWCFHKTAFPSKPTCIEGPSRATCSYRGITESQCLSHGCCWSQTNDSALPWCYYPSTPLPPACRGRGPRFSCGDVGINSVSCIERGCCWEQIDYRYIPGYYACHTQSPVYTVTAMSQKGASINMTIEVTNHIKLPYGDNISPLLFQLTQETDDRLHIKITDPNNKRWEVPESILPSPPSPSEIPANPKYIITLPKPGEEFYFAMQRRSDMHTIFNTSTFGPLTFADQYISIGTGLPRGYNIYGPGEKMGHLRGQLRRMEEPCMNGISMFSSHRTVIPINANLHGVHPFYMDVREPGNAHGVFLKNSNAMDIVMTETSLQYKITGGILDFYFFLGPEPEAVVSQYLEVIGRPALPPYWALGFHQSRHGYTSLQDLKDVVEGYRNSKIPLDTIWSDNDYMDKDKDFTLDPERYPVDDVKAFIEDIHSKGMHYVGIIDPGIAIEKGYPAYENGIAQDIFVKDPSGNNLVGRTSPGRVHFPDFHNPKTQAYWKNELQNFITNMADLDGVWIDKNECANLCDGFCPEELERSKPVYYRNMTSGKTFNPRNPPYNINNRCHKAPLSTGTLPVEATYHGGIIEYNAHNLYGISEAIVTYNALKEIRPNKRPFILTRSTYPGIGAYAAAWNGGHTSVIGNLYFTIPMMLNSQIYGTPFVGSDICGYNDDTDEALCNRWMQMGVFYPFARNHNSIGAIPQEFYHWDSIARHSRKALAIRYSLLPYYYTLFYKANRRFDASRPPAATIVRPLFFEFPMDNTTYPTDWRFMLGSALLFSPFIADATLESQITYFPPALWYDWYTHKLVSRGLEVVTYPAPFDIMPIHIRGGSILPLQDPGLTTVESRHNVFSLLIALDGNGDASGDLYVDDGESLDVSNQNTYVTFIASKDAVISNPSGDYASNMPPLDRVTVLGVANKPSIVTLNQKPVTFHFNATSNSLLVGPGLKNPLTQKFTLQWK